MSPRTLSAGRHMAWAFALALALLHGTPYAESAKSRTTPVPPDVRGQAAQLQQAIAARHGLAPQNVAPASSAQAVQPSECPKTAADWPAWRKREVDRLLAPVAKADGKKGVFLDADRVQNRSVRTAQLIDLCAAGYKGKPDDPVAALRSFVEWLSANVDPEGGQSPYRFAHGPGITDKDYIERIKPIASLPCLLTSQGFLKVVSDPDQIWTAWNMVARFNAGEEVEKCKRGADEDLWKTLIYRSEILGTPDDTDAFGRFLVVVPGTTHDRWIQFGIWTPMDRDKPKDKIQNVSVVAAYKGGTTPQPFNAALDWYRVYKPNGDISVYTRYKATNGDTGNCQQCHKAPVIGIHTDHVFEFASPQSPPRAVTDKARRDKMLQEVNGFADGYAAPNPVTSTNGDDAYAQPSNYGPELGPVNKTRSDAFMKSCTSGMGLTASSVHRVKESMQCAECHKATDMGVINFPMATQRTPVEVLVPGKTWPNLVYRYINRGLMPPPGEGVKPPLGAMERKALFNCLTLEYHNPRTRKGLFADWLNEVPPPAVAAKPAHPQSMATMAAAAAKFRGPALLQNPFVPGTAGKADYDATCARCHSVLPGVIKRGPSLFAVYGRASGSSSFPRYSQAYVDAGKPEVGVVWDEANLMQFLIDDEAFLSSKLGKPAASNMDKQYPDEAQRRRIVEYLMTLK